MTERPIECGQCKKPVNVIYKEISEESIVCTEMCEDCPILQAKLHGQPPPQKKEGKTGTLFCSRCRTSLESVKMGQPLGCSECYVVFGELLVGELCASHALSPELTSKLATRRTQAIHIGKSPNKSVDITLSARLSSLNEALNEALKRENYEQAASLRDQIKALKENKDGRST